MELFNRYFKNFGLEEANSDSQRERAYAIRHAVFCQEKTWMPTSPDSLETDHFDASSRHTLLIDRNSGEDIGTLRVIVPPSRNEHPTGASLPIQNMSQAPLIHDSSIVRNAVEASRTCILRKYRTSDQRSNDIPISRTMNIINSIDLMFLPLGLFQFSARIALRNQRPMILTLITRAFHRQLERLGIVFIPVGPPINLSGQRFPCLLPNLATMFDCMYKAHRGAWAIVSNNGELHDLSLDLCTSNIDEPIPAVERLINDIALTRGIALRRKTNA